MRAIEHLWQDVYSATRPFWRRPVTLWTVIVLLSGAIGVATALLSVGNAILAKPAPGVHDATDLRRLDWVMHQQTVADGCCFSEAEFAQLASALQADVLLTAYRLDYATLTSGESINAVVTATVSPTYFDVLGVRLERGDIPRRPGAAPIVISGSAWRRYFGGRGDIIGAVAAIDGSAATIVGVAPDEFQGAALGESVSVWRLLPGVPTVGPRTLSLIARLRSGATASQFQALVGAATGDWAEVRASTGHVRVSDYSAMKPGTALSNRGPLLLGLIGALSLTVLLVVCATGSTLLLLRAVERQREFAIRRAVGAGGVRLQRRMLLESIFVGLLSLLGGVGAAELLTRSIRLPSGLAMGQRVVLDLSLDPLILACACGMTALVVFAISLGPGIVTSRARARDLLARTSTTLVVPTAPFVKLLIALQLALATLLVGQILLTRRALDGASRISLGSHSQQMLLATVTRLGSHAEPLRERLLREPYVESVSVKTRTERVTIRGSARAPIRADMLTVGPAFAHTLGIPLVAGHDLSEIAPGQDGYEDVLITKNLADALWPGHAAIGETLAFERSDRLHRVVGVIADGYYDGIRGGVPRMVISTGPSVPSVAGLSTIYIHVKGDMRTDQLNVSHILQSDPGESALVYLRPLDTDVSAAMWPYHVLEAVTLVAAVGAAVLACLGQFAWSAYSIARRTRELGLRSALGATPRQLVTQVLRETVRHTFWGVAIGAVLGLFAGRATAALVVGASGAITPYIAGAGIVATIGFASTLVALVAVLRMSPATALSETN